MARSIAAPLATVFLCLSSGPTSTPLDAAISDTAQITRGTENRPLEAIDLASLRDVGPPFPDPRHHFIALSPNRRSEEHTSELQSLMRISYAVFCLQHKKQ